MKFLIQIVLNVIILITGILILSGIEFQGSLPILGIYGLVLGILNYLLYLFLRALWLDIIFITLAIFTIAVNIPFLILLGIIVAGIAISGFWSAFWITVIICLTNYSLSAIMHYE
ncbi:MAG: hypothetical protein GF335_04905 [Candidatus Moranbacteria bacterium]|nr:hypothetical protein [Candidatus Moranbacteria bacterium]